MRVLLTDNDNGTMLVECSDRAQATALAAAAIYSDGGVSAWVLPMYALPPIKVPRIIELLQEGNHLSDIWSLVR